MRTSVPPLVATNVQSGWHRSRALGLDLDFHAKIMNLESLGP